MKQISQLRRIIVGVSVIVVFFIAQQTYSMEDCGSIIEIQSGTEYAEPIEDCNFPFGPIQTNETLEVVFNEISLENGGIYEIAGQSGPVFIPGTSPATFGTIYKHRDDDYVVVGNTVGDTITFQTGTYSLYVSEMNLILSDSYLQTIKNFFIPTVYAAIGDRTLITFEVIEPLPPEPEVDPLILQYAPILYFHPDEDYFPMDVESFVQGSALWEIDEEGDRLVESAEDLTFNAFESFIDTGIDTSNMYLAFSAPESPRTINLENAKTTYNTLKQETPAVYYNKMTDTTDYGKTFTVLQYWYFYAMNDWKDKVDGTFTNNHEGDWESTFIFLNEDTNEPEYVAYSAHLNDNNPNDSIFQYDSVRRSWNGDEVEKEGERVKNYVALGSHANYSNAAQYKIIPDIGTIPGSSDYTSDTGPTKNTFTFNQIASQPWTQYTGLWGTLTNQKSFSGPQGPTQINVTGQTRFSEPIEWAGLNNFLKVVINTGTKVVEDTKQGVKLVFNTALEIGTEITIQLQNEAITFGNNITELNPLPFFWEITSNLDNETFSTLLILQYSDEAVEAAGGNEEELVVVYYNPETNELEPLDSEVNTLANTVSATTTHFSWYLLGFQEKEEFFEEPEVVASTTSIQARVHNYGTRIKKPEPQVLGVSTSTAISQITQLNILLEDIKSLINQQTELSKVQRGELSRVLSEIFRILEII